jgi:hypothetical protein
LEKTDLGEPEPKSILGALTGVFPNFKEYWESEGHIYTFIMERSRRGEVCFVCSRSEDT